MKRLILSQGFPPWLGGLPNFMYARCIANPKNITVLAGNHADAEDFDKHVPFRILRYPVALIHRPWWLPDPLLRIIQFIRARRVLAKAIEASSPQILEAATVFPFAVAAITLRSARNMKLLCYALGDDILRPNRTWYSRVLFRWFLSRIDRFIAISTFTSRALMDCGVPAHRIQIIHPPVDLTRFGERQSGDAVRAQWPTASAVVLTLCNLIPKKGIDKVMEAVEILADEHDILYVVAGVGPDRKRLEGLAEKLGISSRVVFTGRVPENRIASLYAACDIFVMPTRIEADGSVEGFGIVYLEAGSQGVPVIGPRIGGSADAIEDGVTGYLVDAADVSEIARRMRQLLENPALARQMGSAGRERATRPTDWAPVTEWN